MKKYLRYIALVILVAATIALTCKSTIISKPSGPGILISPAPVIPITPAPPIIIESPPKPNPPMVPAKPYTADDARKAIQSKYQRDLAVTCASLDSAIKNAAAGGNRFCSMTVPHDLAQGVQEAFKSKGFAVEFANQGYGVRITLRW